MKDLMEDYNFEIQDQQTIDTQEVQQAKNDFINKLKGMVQQP
jgi:hypothetical protein